MKARSDSLTGEAIPRCLSRRLLGEGEEGEEVWGESRESTSCSASALCTLGMVRR